MLIKKLEFKQEINGHSNFIYNIQHFSNSNNSVQLIYCHYDVEEYDQKMFTKLGILLPESIKSSVKKRQSEFLAGRFAAKKAMIFLGFDTINTPTIHTGNHREPIWPCGIIGSITHNSSKAICIAGRTEYVKYLGIDIEDILSIKTAEEISTQGKITNFTLT